jgi:glycosyltransferase involved in cell wall biosynthesis
VLGDEGHTIDLVVFPTGNKISLKNVKIYTIPNIFMADTIKIGFSLTKLTYDILMFWYCLGLVLTRKYDVIHGVEEGGYIASIIGVAKKCPYFFDMDSSIPEQLKYSGIVKNKNILRVCEILEKWCIVHSKSVITVCKALTRKVQNIYGESDIYQIEDIPLDEQNNLTELQLEFIENSFRDSDVINVLYTGNLAFYQGITLLLKAWKEFNILNRNSNLANLLIIGGEPEEIQKYQNYIKVNKISENIQWLGHRPGYEMKHWMKHANILVSPRIHGENTPLKIYSYMASGKPIVATDIESHNQVLDQNTAFLAKPDPKAFAIKLSEAIENKNLSMQKAANAAKLINDKYNYREFRRKILSVYSAINRERL